MGQDDQTSAEPAPAPDSPSERRRPRLPDLEIDAIAAQLRSGQTLDERYRALLFQRTKEAEIAYAGKEPRGSILAETMAVPLQTQKRFGEPVNGWSDRLVFGDNLQVLKTLLDLKQRGELRNADGSPGVRVVYIDPPFATKREFRGKKGQLAYRDKVEGAEFVEYLRRRLVLIHELLSDDGTLYLHLDTRKVHYLKVVLDEIFGAERHFRNEIIWKRSDAHSDAGGQGSTDFGRIHDLILRYTKTDAPIFDPQFLPLPESTVEKWYRHVEGGHRTPVQQSGHHRPRRRGQGQPALRDLRRHPLLALRA